MRSGRISIIVAAGGMIHGVVARSAAAMPPAAPVQREAILRSVIAVRAVLPGRPVIAVLGLLMLRLGAGDERRQAVDVALVFRSRMLLRPRLKLLLRLLRLIVLLIVVLLARIIRLRLARGERLAADMGLLAIAVVVAVIGSRAHLAGRLLLVIGLTLPELLLRRSDDAEIVLGVLIIIFRCNRVPGTLRVTRKLKILFGDMGRRTANFYVRPVGLVHSR